MVVFKTAGGTKTVSDLGTYSSFGMRGLLGQARVVLKRLLGLSQPTFITLATSRFILFPIKTSLRS